MSDLADLADPSVIPRIVARVTVKDSVYRALRDLILDGDLAPGARLVEAELARQLGTSSTPIREALVTLAADGLVGLSPHQGAHVSRLAYAELEERLFMRDALEAAAIDRVVRFITADELAAARAQLDVMRQAMDTGDPRAYRAAQRRSREAWLAAARYPRLGRLVLDLQDQDARVSLFLITSRADRWAQDYDANRRRVDAIADRDAARATAITREWHDALLRELREAIRRDEDGARALLTDSEDVLAGAAGPLKEDRHADGSAAYLLPRPGLRRRARGPRPRRAGQAARSH
jgi:DNA-binding GntR family transcriptional regulator